MICSDGIGKLHIERLASGIDVGELRREVGFALLQACDLGTRRLVIALRPLECGLSLVQLIGKLRAIECRLRQLAIETRLPFRKVVGRGRDGVLVLLFGVSQGRLRTGDRLLERCLRRPSVLNRFLELGLVRGCSL